MQSINRDNNTIQKGVLAKITERIKKMFKRGSQNSFTNYETNNITPSDYLDTCLANNTIEQVEMNIKAENVALESRISYNNLILAEIEKRKKQKETQVSIEDENQETQSNYEIAAKISKYSINKLGTEIIPDLYRKMCDSIRAENSNIKEVRANIFNFASGLDCYKYNKKNYESIKEKANISSALKETLNKEYDEKIKIDVSTILSDYETIYKEKLAIMSQIENIDRSSALGSILFNLKELLIEMSEGKALRELEEKLKFSKEKEATSETPKKEEQVISKPNENENVNSNNVAAEKETSPVVIDTSEKTTSSIVIKSEKLKLKDPQKITKNPILENISLFTLKVTKNRLLIYYKKQFLEALKKYNYRVVYKSPEQLEITDDVDVKSWKNDQGTQGSSIELKTLNKISEMSIVNEDNKEVYSYDFLGEKMVNDAYEKAISK